MAGVLDLKGIASAGGGIDLDGAAFGTLDLKGIASSGKQTGAKLIIRNAHRLGALDMKGIATCSPGNVTFVF